MLRFIDSLVFEEFCPAYDPLVKESIVKFMINIAAKCHNEVSAVCCYWRYFGHLGWYLKPDTMLIQVTTGLTSSHDGFHCFYY